MRFFTSKTSSSTKEKLRIKVFTFIIFKGLRTLFSRENMEINLSRNTKIRLFNVPADNSMRALALHDFQRIPLESTNQNTIIGNT